MLTIEHVIPYLQSKLLISNGVRHNLRLFGIKGYNLWVAMEHKKVSKVSDYQLPINVNEAKLLLKPLTDLYSPYPMKPSLLYIQIIDRDLEQITNEQLLYSMADELIEKIKNKKLLFSTAQLLFKHRFDVFELIPQGFALDENKEY
jgi:hypothetical protein